MTSHIIDDIRDALEVEYIAAGGENFEELMHSLSRIRAASFTEEELKSDALLEITDSLSHLHVELANELEKTLSPGNFDRCLYECCHGQRAEINESEQLRIVWKALRYWVRYQTKLDVTGILVSGFQKPNLAGVIAAKSRFHGDCSEVVIRSTDLTGADLTDASNLLFDDTYIEEVRFPNKPNDPLSILRAKYSGTNFLVVLALSLAALAPHIIKGFVPSKEKMKVWEAVVQYRDGWGQMLLTAGLLLYAGLRGYVTIQMGQIRDAMEWSLRTPYKKDYWRLWHIHKWFLSWFLWVAFGMFCWKVSNWLVSDRPHVPEIDLPDWIKRAASTLWARIVH